MVIGVISTQTYVQALFSAKDSATAAAGCVTAALIVIPVGLPSVMIGMYMHAMHPEINAIDALPFYLCIYLPEWLGGIGYCSIAAVFAWFYFWSCIRNWDDDFTRYF